MPATVPTQEDLDVLKLGLEEHMKLVDAKLLEYDGLPEREKHDFADLELRVKKLEGDPESIAPITKAQEDLSLRVEKLEARLEELAKARPDIFPPEEIQPDVNPEPSPWRAEPADDPVVLAPVDESYPYDPDNPLHEEHPEVDPPVKRSHHKKG